VNGDGPTGSGQNPADRLRAEGLEASSWSNGPGDRYGAHDHSYDKVLVVVSGSITFGLPDLARSVLLTRGDRLDLPAGTTHDAVVGSSGVTCLEAHLPLGTYLAAILHPAGQW
jgi:quercetin dioxygenase-like cupin family protein